MSAAVPADLSAAARVRFVRFIVAHATARPATKILGPAEAMTDDGDCWSAAWRHAQDLRRQGIAARYLEGSCVIPAGRDATGAVHAKNRVVKAHSWVEVDHPLTGSTIVEVTRGYETAVRYRGVVVDCTPGGEIEAATAEWDQNERSSVIEAALADPRMSEQSVLRIIAPSTEDNDA